MRADRARFARRARAPTNTAALLLLPLLRDGDVQSVCVWLGVACVVYA